MNNELVASLPFIEGRGGVFLPRMFGGESFFGT